MAVNAKHQQDAAHLLGKCEAGALKSYGRRGALQVHMPIRREKTIQQPGQKRTVAVDIEIGQMLFGPERWCQRQRLDPVRQNGVRLGGKGRRVRTGLGSGDARCNADLGEGRSGDLVPCFVVGLCVELSPLFGQTIGGDGSISEQNSDQKAVLSVGQPLQSGWNRVFGYHGTRDPDPVAFLQLVEAAGFKKLGMRLADMKLMRGRDADNGAI